MAATGPIAYPKSRLRDLLAESPTFQARCGVATAAAAMSRIYVSYARVEKLGDLQAAMPFAVVELTKDFGYKQWSAGAKNYLRPFGAIRLILADNDRNPKNVEASDEDFENFVGGVLLDMASLSAVDDRLAVIQIDADEMPARNPTKDHAASGSYQHAAFLFRWE